MAKDALPENTRVLQISPMLNDPSNLDVSKFSYEEWLGYFFEQRLLAEDEFFGDAFCSGYLSFEASDPVKVVSYLQRICTEFSVISGKYSLPQLNQGFWAILGPDFELQQYLWQQSVPLTDRTACIRSMYRPYANFIAGHPAAVMENCFDMWWDLVLKSYRWRQHNGNYDFTRLDSDGRALLDAAFETLCLILSLNDERCQAYALHGLGHLHHPGVIQVVQRFIDSHRSEMNSENLLWLEQCRDGTVM
ncbi:MAG: hypothetical protein JWQ71_2034 [Pedosphaera sp.]|nr:hypothetical protein [Pedosphaera sp.]